MNKCSMLGCTKPIDKFVSVGPGTYIGLCEEHVEEVEEETSYPNN